ncbi:hypothetical protein TNCV_4308501 [Trichonephila clavipes]|nr:hypothetical protein TNCV_4308501 [Trichonephila clavipes]
MSFTRKPGSGHPRPSSRLEDHHIVRNAHVHQMPSRHSDESRFSPSNDDNNVRVWRPMVNASIMPLLYSDTPLP